MTAKFIQTGEAIDYTPTADVSAGDVVVQEDLVGVAKLDIKADTLGALHVGGVFDFPKETGGGKDIAAGKKVYWHPGDQVAKKTAAGATYLGKAILAAGEDDAMVRVRLEQ